MNAETKVINQSMKKPKEHKPLVISLCLQIASVLFFLLLCFFPFGKIAGESTPTLWDFISYDLELSTDLPSYSQFLVPVKSIATMTFWGGLILLAVLMIKVVYFFKADTMEKIFGYYTSTATDIGHILLSLPLVVMLVLVNYIAVTAFIIDSSFIYWAITLLIIEFVSHIAHRMCLSRYYAKEHREKVHMLSTPKKRNGFFLSFISLISFVPVMMLCSTSFVKNVNTGGFDQPTYISFPINEHLDIYNCDFDKEPRFSTPTNEFYIQKENALYFYTNNYHYYKARIEAIEAEIIEAWDLAGLAEKVKVRDQLEKNFSEMVYGCAYVNFTHTTTTHYHDAFTTSATSTDKVNELTYNATTGDNGEKKWGAKKDLLNYFFEEKIEMQTYKFEKGTDFSSQKIGVKIFYNDGSMKLCYVTPSNAEALSNADCGRHTFEWSDSWGDYSVEITIQ